MNLTQREFVKAGAAKEDEGGNKLQSQLEYVLNAYYETTHPCVEVASAEIEAEGFGNFKINLNVIDHRKYAYYGLTNVEMERTWKDKTLTVEKDLEKLTTNLFGIFDDRYYEDISNDKEQIVALPESAVLNAYVTIKSPVDIIKLRAEDTDDFRTDWVQVYQKGLKFQGGINLSKSAVWNKPLRDEMTEKQLMETYLDHLTTLKDNVELWNGLPLYSGNYCFSEHSLIKKTLEKNIKALKASTDFKTKNFAITGSRDEVLKFIENHDVTYVSVEDARFSDYEKK